MRKALIIILIISLFCPLITLAQTNRRFTGQEIDSSLGTYNYNAREYDPNTGRFLQQDPVLKDGSISESFLNHASREQLNQFLSNPQNLNPYSYTRNNPVKYTDPTGKSAKTFLEGVGTGLVVTGLTVLAISAAPITIPAAVATGIAVVGTAAVGYGTYSNYKAYTTGEITKDQFDYNTGAMLGGLLIPAKGLNGLVKTESTIANSLADEALVCRGGLCNASQFELGNGTPLINGKLTNVSVQSATGLSVEELSKTLRNSKIGVTTVGQIRNSGGDVIPSGSSLNPNHATLQGITPEQAQLLFTPVRINPGRK